MKLANHSDWMKNNQRALLVFNACNHKYIILVTNYDQSCLEQPLIDKNIDFGEFYSPADHQQSCPKLETVSTSPNSMKL